MSRTVTILACLLTIAVVGPAFAQTPATAPTLVLPFESTGTDASLDWLGEASAVLLTDGLRDAGVAVIGRDERVRAFEELHLPVSARLSRATVIKVAQLLGAAELVTGTFRVQDRDMTVQVHSIKVEAGRASAPIAESGPLTEIFALHDRIVRRLATPPAAPPAVPRPPLVAFENYVKGLVAETPAVKATFLESALQDFPSFERARLSLWEVRTDQGDHAAALAAVRPIPATSALYARARFCAATSMLSLQRYDDAFETFTGLTSAPAGTPAVTAAMLGAVNNNLGVIQIRRGSTPQSGTAVYFLTKATEADPAETDYFFNLGYGYVLDRNYQGAIYWLREALRRDPADADAHFVLAAALLGAGSSVEAGRERELARQLSGRYESLLRSAGDRAPVPHALERVQVDPDGSGTLRASVLVGLTAQRDQRDLAAFHLERGRRLVDRGQDTEALTELRRAVYLSPYEAQAHLLIGRIYLRAGRNAEAIDALKISIWSADGAPAHAALAEVLMKKGDTRGARAEAERALALDPASAEAKAVLAQLK